jgi:hypothetical protein
VSLLFGSNVTSERLAQRAKQALETISMDDGMQIDFNDEQPAKANSPRTEARLSGSNVTANRLVQLSKQALGIISTDEGMQIELSDETQKNCNDAQPEKTAS